MTNLKLLSWLITFLIIINKRKITKIKIYNYYFDKIFRLLYSTQTNAFTATVIWHHCRTLGSININIALSSLSVTCRILHQSPVQLTLNICIDSDAEGGQHNEQERGIKGSSTIKDWEFSWELPICQKVRDVTKRIRQTENTAHRNRR